MRMKYAFAATITLGVMACYPLQAAASTFDFSFTGGGVSGTIDLTYGSATDAKVSQGYEVTGISGTFSDSNIGIADASILGLVSVTHSTPEAGNLLAPNDFSRFAVASGLPAVANGFLTYDNLYYPGGSPATASSYPAAGGLTDIYGIMFSIGGGRVVDFWSNGIFGPPGSAPIDYGVAVSTVDSSLDYVASGVSAVPEPASGALLLGGLGLFGLLQRRRRTGAIN